MPALVLFLQAMFFQALKHDDTHSSDDGARISIFCQREAKKESTVHAMAIVTSSSSIIGSQGLITSAGTSHLLEAVSISSLASKVCLVMGQEDARDLLACRAYLVHHPIA